MEEFKAGDVVVCVLSHEFLGLFEGLEYVVSYITDDGFVHVQGASGDWCKERFNLVRAASAWSYTEADKLRKTALDAMKQYNDYLAAKPVDLGHVPFFIPEK